MDTGEVVVITGASAGVGRATVREFAQRGAAIGLIARDRDRLEQTRREVECDGGRALVLPADVADAPAVFDAAAKIEETFGPIDIWVNGAMTTIFSHFTDITPEDYRRATEVTYLGAVYGTMAALRHMRRHHRGTIVQVGSALSYRAIPLQAPYCGAKFAIRGFTDSVRTELLNEKSPIHITMVQLPAVNTPQFAWCKTQLPNHPQPVPPIFQPEVAAQGIYWAAHHRRREVYVGLSSAGIIWLNKFFPHLLDKYLAASAVNGQQSPEPVAADRPENLYHPVAADYAAHGEFDRQAHGRSLQFWMTTHRRSLLAAGGLIAGIILGSRWLVKKRNTA
ncbi:MAG: SDR family oxidoreductase [Desulfobacterales bacterium]